jgi:ACS family tartrate transporter-like MFS transporter
VYRAKIVGIFMVTIPVAGFIGSPISSAIVGMDGVLGLGGWQWIFIPEALATLVWGLASFHWLTDRPEHAPWLPPQHQQWPIARLAVEGRRETKIAHQSV